jgi:GntR family transcriptional repressor for pyruvate dehydrogenase complex
MASNSSRADEIADELRREILTDRYRAGERLPSERDLAERFGTSRGAIREAVKKLEQLGIATVQPGGARVLPIAQASLDVVSHLLDLSSPPDPEIVKQVLEVGGGILALTARLAAEYASDEQLAGILEHVSRIQTAGEDRTQVREAILGLGPAMIEASGNMVLVLVNRGLQTQIISRLESHAVVPKHDMKAVRKMARDLTRAFESREPSDCAEAMHRLFRELHESVVRALNEAHAELNAPTEQIG